MKNERYNLFSCLWELTLRCSLNCKHCGSVAGASRDKELSLNESFRIADEIVDLGCKELTFIGGEIFLYKGWEQIANRLNKNGVVVNLMSNGYNIQEKQIEQIKFAKLSNVGISLDGTEEVHNFIRNNTRSYANIIRSFDNLNKAKIPIGVVTTLMEPNYSTLEELYQILIDNKVNLWQIQLANPMGNMANNRDLLLNPKHVPEVIDFIRDKNRDRYMLLVAADNVGYYHHDTEPYIRGTRSVVSCWGGCMAGINSLFIDSIGNVKGCGALYDEKFIEGNVKTELLADIWHNEENFGYNRNFETNLLTGKCKECDLGDVCKGGCRASNYFTNDNLYENAFCAQLN